MALQIYPNSTNTAFYFVNTDSGVENIYTRGELAITYDGVGERFSFRPTGKPYAGIGGYQGYLLSDIQNESGGTYASKEELFSYLDTFFFKSSDSLPPVPIVFSSGKYNCPGGLNQGVELADGSTSSEATLSMPQSDTEDYTAAVIILEGFDVFQGEDIISANLGGKMIAYTGGALPPMRVYGQLPVIANQTPSLMGERSISNDITSRPKTAASTPVKQVSTSVGLGYPIADVSDIVREIVNNSNYRLGRVAFIIEIETAGSHNGEYFTLQSDSISLSIETKNDSSIVWTERGARNSSIFPAKLGSLAEGETDLIYDNDPVAKVGRNFSIEGERGFILPRLTTSQRDALTPIAGMVVYNTNTDTAEYYNGTSWVAM